MTHVQTLGIEAFIFGHAYQWLAYFHSAYDQMYNKIVPQYSHSRTYNEQQAAVLRLRLRLA